MPTFEVKIDEKTYHVDIPWLGNKPLPVIVDGHPMELVLGGPTGIMAQDLLGANGGSIKPANGKPVPAEWHASIREE